MTTELATPNATAWVDRIMNAHWDALSAYAKKHKLPMPGSLTHGRRRRTMQEYGCGHYGCVMPAAGDNARNLVIKLSSDATEASFVAQALKVGDFPEGVVRYHGLVQLSGERHRNRAVYVLWREEAASVGAHWWRGGPVEREAGKRLDQFRGWATRARERMKRAPDPVAFLREAEESKAWAEEHVYYDLVDRYQEGRAYGNQPDPMGSWIKGARAFAYSVRAAQIIAEQMTQEDVGYLIGGAFEFYLEHGMLLADVHGQNVGTVNRPDYAKPVWVITDPGHMVPLSAPRMSFTVEQLGAS